MKVKLLVAMAGAHYALSAGDIHECSDDEGARLIEAGYAEKAPKGAVATLTPRPPEVEAAVEAAPETPEDAAPPVEAAVEAVPETREDGAPAGEGA